MGIPLHLWELAVIHIISRKNACPLSRYQLRQIRWSSLKPGAAKIFLISQSPSIAGGELASGISRGREEKMVGLFLLAWKMCVVVRADVFLRHLSCLSSTAPCGLHTHLLSGECWCGERQTVHRKSAEHWCTNIRRTWLFFFSPSLKNPLPTFPFFFFL